MKGWQYDSPVRDSTLSTLGKTLQYRIKYYKKRLSQLNIQSFSTSAFLFSFLCFWTTEEVEIFPVVLNNQESPRFLEV